MSKIVREKSRFSRVARTKNDIISLTSPKIVTIPKETTKIVREKSDFTRKAVTAKISEVSENKLTPNTIFQIQPELIPELAENLTCQDIRNMALIDNKFANLVKNNQLINKAKTYGYPRKSNHAKVFNVEFENLEYKRLVKLTELFANVSSTSAALLKMNKEDSDYFVAFFNKLKGPYLHASDPQVIKRRMREPLRNMIIQKFKYQPLPRGLIKGDLISVAEIMFIFDGCDAIYLNENDLYILPEQFEVIKDNISVNYWAAKEDFYNPVDGIIFQHSNGTITHAVNFNNLPYLDQITDSLEVDFLELYEFYVIKGYFRANNRTYTIRFDIAENSAEEAEARIYQISELLTSSIPFMVDGYTEDLLIVDFYDK